MRKHLNPQRTQSIHVSKNAVRSLWYRNIKGLSLEICGSVLILCLEERGEDGQKEGHSEDRRTAS